MGASGWRSRLHTGIRDFFAGKNSKQGKKERNIEDWTFVGLNTTPAAARRSSSLLDAFVAEGRFGTPNPEADRPTGREDRLLVKPSAPSQGRVRRAPEGGRFSPVLSASIGLLNQGVLLSACPIGCLPEPSSFNQSFGSPTRTPLLLLPILSIAYGLDIEGGK